MILLLYVQVNECGKISGHEAHPRIQYRTGQGSSFANLFCIEEGWIDRSLFFLFIYLFVCLFVYLFVYFCLFSTRVR